MTPSKPSFFDELEKISKKKEKKYGIGHQVAERAIAFPIAHVGTVLPSNLAAAGFGRSLQGSEALQRTSAEQAERLRQAISPKDALNYVERGGLHDAFSVGRPEAKIVKSQMPLHGTAVESAFRANPEAFSVATVPGQAGPHVAAHELGHSAAQRSILGRAARLSRGVGMLAGTYGGLGMAMMAQDPDGTVAKAAPLVGAVGALPLLGEEAYASIRGLRGMHQAGFDRAAIGRGMLGLGKAFGTYAAAAAPMVAAPYIFRKIRSAYRKRVKESK